MNSIAEIQIHHTRNAIINLESALQSIEHYKKQVELTLYLLKDLRVGDEKTGQLSPKDYEFLYHANCIGNDFRDEKKDGTPILSILDSLEKLNQKHFDDGRFAFTDLPRD